MFWLLHFNDTVGAHYEITNPGSGESVSKYYFAGTTRIAMRKYTIPQNMSVEYTLGDHLGSTSLTTDSAGNKVSEIRYKPFGETRYTWIDSTLNNPANPDDKASPVYALTKYQFTGQYSYESEFGLLFYNARFYDSQLGRFTSADTIVPGGVQGYDRYAYVNNSPVNFTDPTGHTTSCSTGDCGAGGSGRITKSSPGAFHEADENHHSVLFGGNSGSDVTPWLANELDKTLKSGDILVSPLSCPSAMAMAICMTIKTGSYYGILYGSHWSLFNNSGVYNIKLSMKKNFPNGAIVLCGVNSCRWVDYSTAGNIMFGVLSSTRGINRPIAWVMGGAAERYDTFENGEPYTGSISTWGDNPGDKAAVDWGWEFGEAHPNGFTLQEFQSALTADILNSFQAPPIGNYPDAHPQPNIYPPGYFLNR